MEILSEIDNNCVLVHDKYADIAEISISKEKFKLKGYFQFLNESIIFWEKLKVSFHSFLFLNDYECPFENINNGRVAVKI